MAASFRSSLQRWGIVITALAAPMLGGSTERWSQGVVLVLLAVAVLLRAPSLFIGKAFAGVAAGALVLCALAWAPASLWGGAWWRPILGQELGMTLPTTYSVQPWLSADAFVLLVAGLLWLLLIGAREWTSTERRSIARSVCAGLMVLTAAWLIVYYKGWRVPIWTNDRNFGPFPNRNQTGDLLATWSVVAAAFAVEDFRRGRQSGVFWLGGIGLFFWGLIVNYSRAGVILFFFGLVGWGSILLMRQRSMRYLAIGGAAVLVAFSLFLLFGGSTLARFTGAGSLVVDPTKDYRALVFQDAWQMAVKSPWPGVGLGNFEGMFTLARHASANDVRLLHPESDWLWLLAETGWFGPLLAFGLVALFVRRIFPLERKTAVTIRSAAVVGALLFVLHGFFDVSGHRLGSAIPALLLFGIAARLPWTAAPSAVQPWLARLCAAGLAVIGCGWIVASVERWEWPGAIGVEVLAERARTANEAEEFPVAIQAADRAIAWAPLDWQKHYLRGVAHAFLEQPEKAEQDFLRARRLEPSIASASFEEGLIWIYFDPARAKDAWRATLEREPRRRVGYFQQMLLAVGNRPPLRQMLRELAGGQTELLLQWLSGASREEFAVELDRLKSSGRLDEWTPAQLAGLFAAWLRFDRAELIQAIESNPTWYVAGWRQLAAAYAAEKQFDRACQIVYQSQPPPVFPELSERDLAEVERAFASNRRDFITGYQLYRARVRSNDWAGALAALDTLAGLPDAPPYLTWQRAEALQHVGRWSEAWDALAQTLR